MHNYELTERGKIVIAVILVFLFLIIPSAILLYTATQNQPSLPADSQGAGASGNNSPPPVTSPPPVVAHSPPVAAHSPSPATVENPPPSSGGFSDFDVSPPGDGSGREGHYPEHVPVVGPIGGNPSEGTLSFLFSTELQYAMDAKTLNMLDEFLHSSKNTGGNLIAVELPRLPGDAAEGIVSMVGSAFCDRGIYEQRLVYIPYPVSSEGGIFVIHLSYIPRSMK